MTSKRVTSFTVGKGIALPWEGTVAVEVAAFYVPTLLHRLEVYKERFAYSTDEEYGQGLDLVNRQQEAYLMDIGERIISEVRATRDGAFTPVEARDPQADPYTLPLTSLRTVAASVDDTNADLSSLLGTTNATLQEILVAVQQQGGGEGVLEKLDVLIALLGAVA